MLPLHRMSYVHYRSTISSRCPGADLRAIVGAVSRAESALRWSRSRKLLRTSVSVMAESIRNGSQVGGVFFDMDDTLVLTHRADSLAHSEVLDLVKSKLPVVDGSAVLRAFMERFVVQAWDPEHKIDVKEWRAGLWAQALEKQGVHNLELAKDMQRVFDDGRLRAFRWAPGVEVLITQLHAQGIKVGIITNGHTVIQRAKLQACKAYDLFKTVLVGGEEPNPKPHKSIFLKACRLAGCRPEESIMVGDTLATDIQGAANSGFLSTVWVNVHGESLSSDGPQPCFVISSIGELEEVLKQLGVAL